MAGSKKNVLVSLQKYGEKNTANFKQCILDYFGNTDDMKMNVAVEFSENRLLISDKQTSASQLIKIVHPSFCPFHHLTAKQQLEIPDETLNRGVNVGVSVLVESADGKVLLSRRAAHLRTFPGIWVPPGGHVEHGETLIEAGLRELEEEVGLHLEPQQFSQSLQILALWESTFPAKLICGLPKRHHVVTYLYGKLSSQSSDVLLKQIKMDANETDACIWVDKEIAKVIDLSREDTDSEITIPPSIHQTIKSVIFNNEKEQVISDLNILPLFKRFKETDDKGRVSSGTKMALHEWLKLTNRQTFVPFNL